jgi:elongator complex protein 2
MQVKIDFLTAGCNNETGIFDEYNGFIIYAGGRNVLVSKIPRETDSRSVTCALPFAPKGRVHACQWMRLNDYFGVLVASDDGFLRCYHCSAPENPLSYTSWSIKMEFNLGSAVTLASFIPVESNSAALIAAVTVKGEIFLIDSTGSCHFIRSYAPKKITALAIGILPNSQVPFILAALSDSTIRVLIDKDEVLTVSGHQNWITSLSVKAEAEGDFVNVLTSSLDKTIRVWKIQESAAIENNSSPSVLLELVPQKNSFILADGKKFSLVADSLALGHENAVFFARFIPSTDGSLQILSGSSDRSLILWNRGFGGAWRTALQLGDLNGSLGTIGTDHTFSFYGGTIFNNEWIVAAASTGSILFWKRSSNSSQWIPQIPITGHVDCVESIAWAPPAGVSAASFLISTSKDQTTRIFAPSTANKNYREIARPQIHGYDLKCVTLASFNRQNTRVFELVSGADEKVLRVFTAPKQFYRKLNMEIDELVPESAELPALGLSNKTSTNSAINDVNPNKSVNNTDGDQKNHAQSLTDSTASAFPENEGDLVRNSLWPETDKLYGHNQEISAIALSPDHKYMASAAKSHLAADAALRIWSRSADGKWLPVTVVPAHNLTVACLVFSPDSQKLLSVSRDRNFCLISPENGAILKRQEGHSRMIFSADWVDNESFVTGSRDKTVKYWKISQNEASLAQTINFENGITSVAIFKKSILAAGDELGNIFFYKLLSETSSEFVPLECSISGGGGLGPADSITDLKWNGNVEGMELAVASADNSIRIISFYL